MPTTPTPRSTNAGFSIIELMTAMGIMMLATTALVTMFMTTTLQRRDAGTRLELNHGLRASLDSIVRDVRLAGACLPQNGEFIGMGATNAGTSDTITIRIGQLDDSNLCVATTLAATAAAGATTVDLNNVNGFAADGRIYLRNAQTGLGEYATVSSVDAGLKRLTLSQALASGPYPVEASSASGVYGIEEKTYSIGSDGLGNATLDVTLDAGSPVPLAVGIDRLNVQYRLRRNCGTTCDVVDVPNAATGEWLLVTDLLIEARAALARPGTSDLAVTTSNVTAKPRNLQPAG